MKAYSIPMRWVAIAIAAIATMIGWAVSPQQIAFILFPLAFIFCLAELADAVNRCANALEKRN